MWESDSVRIKREGERGERTGEGSQARRKGRVCIRIFGQKRREGGETKGRQAGEKEGGEGNITNYLCLINLTMYFSSLKLSMYICS